MFASGDRLVGQLGDGSGEQPVDGDAVLARLGQQRVADYPVVPGVFFDRLVCELFKLRQFASHRGDGLRTVFGQQIEVLFHARAGCVGVAFGEHQQADGEIGHPIAHLAKGDLRAVRLFDDSEQFGRLDHSRRILGEFAVQIEIGSDQNEEERARQQNEPGADRQPSHDLGHRHAANLSETA